MTPIRSGPLILRVVAVAVVLVTEMVLRRALLGELSGAIDYFPLSPQIYSLPVAWIGALAILIAAGGSSQAGIAATQLAGRGPHPGLFIAHIALVIPVIWPAGLESVLGVGFSIALMQGLQHLLVAGAVLALLLAVIRVEAWRILLRGSLPLVALVLAVAAVLVFRASQDMWLQSAGVTFRIVSLMLAPFYPELQVDSQAFSLANADVKVRVMEACSGLEGVGMMLVFGAGWLWYLRREFRFPRALLMLPVAVLLVFVLNAVRIALLFAIAAHGQVEIARAGFHSQAGWIFFNAAAFLVALASRRISWIRRPEVREPVTSAAGEVNPVAAFLLPMLAVLATGMLTRTMSAGFDQLYWLRLPVALALLLMFRRVYSSLDWRFSWRGIGVGVFVFAIWLLAAHWLSPPADMPAALAQMAEFERDWWIAMRALIAVLIVPVVEELAFRGFLMRRLLSSADFSALRMKDVRPVALLISSVLFGLSHGGYWLPGIISGLLFGGIAIRTNRFGEAVVAHAVANALLALTVLGTGRWQLW